MVQCLISPRTVGVALLSSLSVLQAQTKEVQYGMAQVKPIEYFRYRCTAWKAGNMSVACTGCQTSVCTQWIKEKLTPAEVQQITRNRKK